MGSGFNIYVLKRLDDVGYDETEALVIVAEDEESARWRAAEQAPGDQDRCIWLDDKASCTLIGNAIGFTSSQIILVDFRAG